MSRNLKKVDHGKTLVALSHAISGKITTPAYLMQEEIVTLGHIEGKICVGSLVSSLGHVTVTNYLFNKNTE